MQIRNETWRVEVDVKAGTVELFHKDKTLAASLTIKEFCALGALVKQVKEGGVQ